jgi:hypothetical protein
LRDLNIAPHVAQNTTTLLRHRSRTTRHPGYAVSQTIRKRIEESFAWTKTIAALRKPNTGALAASRSSSPSRCRPKI